jgi:hypothetical protein
VKGRPANTDDSFWDRVVILGPDECWPWSMSTKNGYGRFTQDKVEHYAHRHAYELTYGPVPDGLHVMHRCDYKRCCNPSHLIAGTPAQNTSDAYSAGLIQKRLGEAHHRARLTADQALAVFYDKRTYRAIGKSYGIALTTVSSIKNGYTWAHLTGGRNASAA